MIQKEKLPEIHFERYLRGVKKMLGINPVAGLTSLLASHGIPVEETGDGPVDAYLGEIMPGYRMAASSVNPAELSYARLLREGLFHTCAFSRHKRVFRMERGITQRLLHTSIEHVDTSFVKTPFPSCYFVLPHNEELAIPDSVGNKHLVEGFYVWSSSEKDPNHVFLSMNRYGRTAASEVGSSGPVSLLKILAVGKPDGKDGDSPLYYTTFILGPGDAFDHLQRTLDKWSEVPENRPYTEALFRFVLNVLIYLNSGDPCDNKEEHKVLAMFEKMPPRASTKDKERVERKNEGLSKIDQIRVGHGIPTLAGMDDYYAGGGWSIGCPRWLVRGHWRNQAHGAGLALRKVIWIQPHVKGTGIGTGLEAGRDYKII